MRPVSGFDNAGNKCTRKERDPEGKFGTIPRVLALDRIRAIDFSNSCFFIITTNDQLISFFLTNASNLLLLIFSMDEEMKSRSINRVILIEKSVSIFSGMEGCWSKGRE